MPVPPKTLHHSSSRAPAAPDHHHPYPWRLKPSMNSKDEYATHRVALSPEERSSSWETQAYSAEDASTVTVGMWPPPLAYSCGFCHREFRSAQALGGHMNVHRRDRARLRQSSPPAPFHATLNNNIPLQTSSNNMHKSSQHEYCSSTCVTSPSVECPQDFPYDSISKASTSPPTTLSSLSAIIPYQSSSGALTAKHRSDMAASFSLHLQRLAASAASSLLLPQPESLDLISRWPCSALASRNGCRSIFSAAGIQCNNATDMSAWSGSAGSCSSVPSRSNMGLDSTVPCMKESKPRRLGSCHISAPIIQPEDERPKKKSNFTDSPNIQMYQVIMTNSPMNDGTNHAQEIKVTGSACCDHVLLSTSEACSDQCVDLELRLGQRPL